MPAAFLIEVRNKQPQRLPPEINHFGTGRDSIVATPKASALANSEQGHSVVRTAREALLQFRSLSDVDRQEYERSVTFACLAGIRTVDNNDIDVDIEPILKRIEAGDRQAFANVVRHYQRPLFGFLGRMGLNQSDAEEIAQETFLRAWMNLGKYKPDIAQFSTWLFTIARNLALAQAFPRSKPARDDGGRATSSSLRQPQPPEELVIAEQKRRLHAALLKLPLAERSAVALVYVKGLELAAIARIEGCTTGAVKTRVHRAKQKLRQLLEQYDG